MLFTGIEMSNFGRYAGKHTIATPVTRDRNVILVRASNDRGKTTLFRAIKYALYGEHGMQASSWINFQAAARGDGEMYVEIRFEHGGRNYRLRRSVGFHQTEMGMDIATRGSPRVELFDEDGPVEGGGSRDAYRDRIDGMLPMDASQFFFFDGEEIQKYIGGQSASVEDAVKKVLGIKELFNAKEDMEKVKIRIDAEYSRNARKQSKNEKERDNLERLDEELATIKNDIESQEVVKRGAGRQQEDLRAKLLQYKSIESAVEERERAKREIGRIEREAAEIDKVLGKQMGGLGAGMLAGLLYTIDKGGGRGGAVDEYEEKTIRGILDQPEKTCICGRPVDAEAHRELKARMSGGEPSVALQLRRLVQRLLIDVQPGKIAAELRQTAERRSGLTRDMDAQQTVVERCTNKINTGAPLEEMRAVEAQYEEAGREIGRCNSEIQRLNTLKHKLEHEKDKMEMRIEAGADDAQLQDARRRKDVCDSAIDGIQEAIERYYKKRKPELENLTSKIFCQLTNNPEMYRGVKIDRRFSLHVARHDGTSLPTDKYSPSAGASQIVATAMIGGLNRFATKDAPIVIDTPLGRLDPIHRTNVMTYYSQMGKQIIILYQPSEIDEGDLESIRDKLAAEWTVESVPGNPDLSRIKQEVSYL